MLLGFHGKLLTPTQETRKKTTEGTLSNTLLTLCAKALLQTRKGEHRTHLKNDVMSAVPS